MNELFCRLTTTNVVFTINWYRMIFDLSRESMATTTTTITILRTTFQKLSIRITWIKLNNTETRSTDEMVGSELLKINCILLYYSQSANIKCMAMYHVKLKELWAFPFSKWIFNSHIIACNRYRVRDVHPRCIYQFVSGHYIERQRERESAFSRIAYHHMMAVWCANVWVVVCV